MAPQPKNSIMKGRCSLRAYLSFVFLLSGLISDWLKKHILQIEVWRTCTMAEEPVAVSEEEKGVY